MGMSLVVWIDLHAMLLPALAPMYFKPLEKLQSMLVSMIRLISCGVYGGARRLTLL
jgi:hypothetical protein